MFLNLRRLVGVQLQAQGRLQMPFALWDRIAVCSIVQVKVLDDPISPLLRRAPFAMCAESLGRRGPGCVGQVGAPSTTDMLRASLWVLDLA